MFAGITRFLHLFVKGNTQNRKEVLPYFSHIVSLSKFQYDAERSHELFDPSKVDDSPNFFRTFKNQPIKVSHTLKREMECHSLCSFVRSLR